MSSLKILPGTRHYSAVIGIAIFAVTLAVVAQVNFSLMRDLAQSRYGPSTARMVEDWQSQIDAMKYLPDEEKLLQTNHFFNSRIRWAQDTYIWEKDDYWATPLEVMGRRMGDCEDFAIAKYVTLVLAGVDIDKLRITYVKAQETGTDAINGAHMVLAYYPSVTAEPMILDNLLTDILPASQRPDLTPVYGFNSKGIWVGGASTPITTRPGANLSRWRDLLRRASEEGIG